MRVTCTNCGGAHATWDCKRPAKKSTGRKNVFAPAGGEIELLDSANNAALPVDTNSEKGRVFAAPLGLASPANAQDAGTANTKDAPIQKRPRGRPKSITDMKTYKAAKQREYRAKWKGRE